MRQRAKDSSKPLLSGQSRRHQVVKLTTVVIFPFGAE